MKLQDIYIYPIKSLGGIQLKSCELTNRGLKNDRRFMLITKENGIFMTQRKYREMALFRTALRDDKILVLHKDRPENIIAIPTEPLFFNGEQRVEVWGTFCNAKILDDFVNNWFSEALGVDCQLVYMPETSKRAMKEKYSPHNDLVSFADGSPILIIGQAGLDDLNNRLESPVPMDRFRPNFVFSGGAPFEEDKWKSIKIGQQQFRITHTCVRCNMPNIDQETAQIVKEPNKTLATFRRFGREIHVGVNAVWEPNVALDSITVRKGEELIVQ
jgi:uncharacterized protein YcbX